jgi:hypothetical protein
MSATPTPVCRWRTAEYVAPPLVRAKDFRRFLRLPNRRALDGAMAETAAWAQQWFTANARPWRAVCPVPLQIEAAGISVCGTQFGGPALAHRFMSDVSAQIVAISAGPELDAETAARWRADEPDRFYFLECYAAAAVDTLFRATVAELASAGGLAADKLTVYAPGYPDWPMRETVGFLATLRAAIELPGPLAALESGMLTPKKSRLALVALPAAESLSS